MEFIYMIIDRITSHIELGAFLLLCFFNLASIFTVIMSYRDSIKRTNKKYSECTMGVWAEVLDVRIKKETIKRRVKTKNGYKTKTDTIIYYIPTLKFDFNFETIEKECDTGNRSNNKYIVGEQVKIFIDPKDINNMRYDDEPLEVVLKRIKKRHLISFLFLLGFWGFIWAIIFGLI